MWIIHKKLKIKKLSDNPTSCKTRNKLFLYVGQANAETKYVQKYYM
jgi:hypothetical protein